MKRTTLSSVLPSDLTSPPEKIISSARDIMMGESPMSGTIAMKVIKLFREPETSDKTVQLTDIENDILTKLTHGYRYKEIAELLSVNDQTIKVHLRCIYEKLHVNSRKDAINKFFGTISHEKT